MLHFGTWLAGALFCRALTLFFATRLTRTHTLSSHLFRGHLHLHQHLHLEIHVQIIGDISQSCGKESDRLINPSCCPLSLANICMSNALKVGKTKRRYRSRPCGLGQRIHREVCRLSQRSRGKVVRSCMVTRRCKRRYAPRFLGGVVIRGRNCGLVIKCLTRGVLNIFILPRVRSLAASPAFTFSH